MSPVERILDRLEGARRQWRVFSVLCHGVLLVTAALIMLALLVMCDAWFRLSQAGLWTLAAMWLVALLLLSGYTIFRFASQRRSLAGTARCVEMAYPEIGNDLINLIQLTRQAEPGGGLVAADRFRAAALADAASHLQGIAFHRAPGSQTRWQRFRHGLQTPRDLAELGCMLAAVILGVAGLALLLPTWSSSVNRLLTPWKFVPQTGRVQILEVTPGDAQLLLGAPLEVVARIASPRGEQPSGTIWLAPPGQAPQASPMLANSVRDRFVFSLPGVSADLEYHVQIGDSQSQRYRIRVHEKPTVRQVQVTYEYADYLGREDDVVEQQHGDLEAPQYTIAHLQIFASTSLAGGHVQLDQQKVAGRLEKDGRSLRVDMLLTESASYTIHLFNAHQHTDAQPRVNKIRVLPDAAPTVQLAKPASEMTAAPGGQVDVVVRAGDDHALGSVRLECLMPGSPSGGTATDVEVLQQWQQRGPVTVATHSCQWQLDSARLQPGQTVSLRAVAVDRRDFAAPGIRLQPQETASPWLKIQLIDRQTAVAEELALLDGIHARLWAILQNQMQARITAGSWMNQRQLELLRELVEQVGQRQVRVQQATVELADSLQGAVTDGEAELKQALARLASGDMIVAVEQSEAAARMKQLAEVADFAPPLIETQQRIIEQLRGLLDLSRAAATEKLAELGERPGGDLPSDIQEKLSQLAEKLEEFQQQQKRVIEATENLAKKPVDDFTEEEEQLLKDLAAIEDDWSRFLEETHSDFSKLPEQDFANPSLLEELVEVQTELKMAADALTKKTADIAVPLEQLGAEMAEELMSNLEKWLPDTPDRERWSQEEYLTDELKEAPMAELPGELEDIVGELMEQEEDLFDEMEDVSSSAADSLDKGAGWDAMDGPISNMSAKGVTGNRLPNTSEIGGRAGEGRQGKSSGEFVADTAVGKGGRKTPSRLAPDPFMKGQVKDLSKDPVGGATGGGKESGAGGGGLEGPVPDRPQRDLPRLAQRQADLRNRAEAVELKFQVLRYQHTDLKRLIEIMAVVEADLRGGRYQNALRRRDVLLDGLQNIHSYLGGEIQVRKDQTSSLPADIQKELLGGAEDASPAGWEELNRRYFERLTQEK